MSHHGTLGRVKENFDLEDYALSRFDSVKWATNGELRVCCPNCGDKNHKLYLNQEKNLFNCYKCGFGSRGYDIFDLVAATDGISRGDAILATIKEYAWLAPQWSSLTDSVSEEPQHTPPPPVARRITMPAGTVPLLPVSTATKPFVEYLKLRGVNQQEMEALRPFCTPNKTVPLRLDGKYRGDIGHRVFFPIYGGDNFLVSWIARTITNREPKYLNAPDTDLTSTFWPYIPPKERHAVLVEGVLDSLAGRRHGYPCYATFGKKISTKQILLLKRWGVTSVTLFWDKRDALKEMQKAVEDLKMHFNTTVPDFSLWTTKQDLGDCLRDTALVEPLRKMLQDGLIDTDSWEYVQWGLL